MNENQRLGFYYIRQCNVADSWAIFCFQINSNEIYDSMGPEQINSVKVGQQESFYSRHTKITTSCSEGKLDKKEVHLQQVLHTVTGLINSMKEGQ